MECPICKSSDNIPKGFIYCISCLNMNICGICNTLTYQNYCVVCYRSTMNYLRQVNIIPISSKRSNESVIEILLTLLWIKYYTTSVYLS